MINLKEKPIPLKKLEDLRYLCKKMDDDLEMVISFIDRFWH